MRGDPPGSAPERTGSGLMIVTSWGPPRASAIATPLSSASSRGAVWLRIGRRAAACVGRVALASDGHSEPEAYAPCWRIGPVPPGVSDHAPKVGAMIVGARTGLMLAADQVERFILVCMLGGSALKSRGQAYQCPLHGTTETTSPHRRLPMGACWILPQEHQRQMDDRENVLGDGEGALHVVKHVSASF